MDIIRNKSDRNSVFHGSTMNILSISLISSKYWVDETRMRKGAVTTAAATLWRLQSHSTDPVTLGGTVVNAPQGCGTHSVRM